MTNTFELNESLDLVPEVVSPIQPYLAIVCECIAPRVASSSEEKCCGKLCCGQAKRHDVVGDWEDCSTPADVCESCQDPCTEKVRNATCFPICRGDFVMVYPVERGHQVAVPMDPCDCFYVYALENGVEGDTIRVCASFCDGTNPRDKCTSTDPCSCYREFELELKKCDMGCGDAGCSTEEPDEEEEPLEVTAGDRITVGAVCPRKNSTLSHCCSYCDYCVKEVCPIEEKDCCEDCPQRFVYTSDSEIDIRLNQPYGFSGDVEFLFPGPCLNAYPAMPPCGNSMGCSPFQLQALWQPGDNGFPAQTSLCNGGGLSIPGNAGGGNGIPGLIFSCEDRCGQSASTCYEVKATFQPTISAKFDSEACCWDILFKLAWGLQERSESIGLDNNYSLEICNGAKICIDPCAPCPEGYGIDFCMSGFRLDDLSQYPFIQPQGTPHPSEFGWSLGYFDAVAEPGGTSANCQPGNVVDIGLDLTSGDFNQAAFTSFQRMAVFFPIDIEEICFNLQFQP